MKDLPATVAPAFERHFMRDGEPELPDLDEPDDDRPVLDPEDEEVRELIRDIDAWERSR